LILRVQYWCAAWQGLHYCITSEDYMCHNIQVWIATVLAVVSIKSVMCCGCCHWNWCSCAICTFCVCDIYSNVCNVLKDCPDLLVWFMIDSAISFLSFASRLYPDKKMKSIVRLKLSLISFIRQMWDFWVMCEQVCVCNMTHSVYVMWS
jgi:hypothetical protein